ncbi:MAG: acyl carrier protein [Candidatus Cloacimonetes bacterium]|nr:acyl carrier protein [Candidatus Cloacimonadota bacterium]
MALFDEVKKIVVEQLGAEENKVRLDTKLMDDLGADSLDLIELVMRIEGKFDINIYDKYVKNIVTVGDAVKAIKERIKVK